MSKRHINKSPLATRLREARLLEGLSQRDLGIKAGFEEFSSSPRVNQYEREKHVPDFQTAKRLALALNIPVTYLYAEEDDIAEVILKYYRANKKKKRSIINMLNEK